MSKYLARIATVVALVTGLIYLYTAYFGVFGAFTQRGILLGASLLIVFLTKPFRKGGKTGLVDAVLGLVAAASVMHFVTTQWDFLMRGGAPLPLDIVWGSILLIALLEATRRAIGLALSLVSLVFIAFAFLGPFMPGLLRHAGVSYEYFISATAMTTEGIWGVPMDIAATYVIIFVIFTSFLQESGAGKFFIDLACALFGKVRGGPAKVAVFGSAVFGTISGSALANVAGTGAITIPLMKRIGYKPEFAGAVEAAASTGGQLMPPIMGAAAFIMAEFLGISYWSVAKAAIVPAFLFFWAIFIMVDFEAGKHNLKGVVDLLNLKARDIMIQGWYLLIPLIILLVLMGGIQYSPMKSAFISLLSVIALTAIRKATRMGPRRIASAIISGVNDVAGIVMACATAGIVISIINISGLGLSFSSLLIEAAGGNLMLLLILSAIASLILGMGLPATPCYILLAILVAPAMVQLGVNPVSAHLFVFYFGMISGLTPPVALAAYVGAGIAQADSMKTGWLATKLGAAGFILPFMFVYDPAYILQGSWVQIIMAIASGSLGVLALAAAFEGFMFTRTSIPERLGLLIAALTLIHPDFRTDLAGYVLIAGIAWINHGRNQKVQYLTGTSAGKATVP